MRRIRLLAAAAGLAAVAVAPAGAVDETKPDVGCFGHLFMDKVGDAVSAGPAGDPAAKPANLDLVDGFLKYDEAQGDDAATVNIRVADLSTAIPQGATAIIWQANYLGSAGVAAWVRAITDFSGLITYDYGGVEETPAIPFNVRQGGTTGAFFEGENGIVQIVVPPTVEPKGTTLKTFTVTTSEAVQALPGAAPTPVKGGSLYEDDSASGGRTTWTVGEPCPAAAPDAPPVTETPSSPAPVGMGEALALEVRTKSVKRGKRLALKVRSAEPLTRVAAQLRKGKRVYAKGARRKLDGNGKIRLRVTRRLKKGTYVVDVAGTDGEGARRFNAAKLKVR